MLELPTNKIWPGLGKFLRSCFSYALICMVQNQGLAMRYFVLRYPKVITIITSITRAWAIRFHQGSFFGLVDIGASPLGLGFGFGSIIQKSRFVDFLVQNQNTGPKGSIPQSRGTGGLRHRACRKTTFPVGGKWLQSCFVQIHSHGIAFFLKESVMATVMVWARSRKKLLAVGC